MVLFEWLIGLIGVSLLLASLARRLQVPYPSLLALGGAGLAFIPGAPPFTIDPHLTLALFVAPVLLDAAFDASLRDLKDNRMPIAGLVLMAVGLTVAAVAVVVRALVPGLSWSAACALGAIVAPPDAAAATAALKQLRPPHRVMTILEGESLLNDATALVIYRVAVGLTIGAEADASYAVLTSGLGVLASLVLGPTLAWLNSKLVGRIQDVPTSILTQFVMTFGLWFLAEALHVSAVLTVVSYAIALARLGPLHWPARLRTPSFAVWDTVVLLLNVLAFALIGLQTGPLLKQLSPVLRSQYLLTAFAVLATVVGVRIAWVMGNNAVVRAMVRRWGFHPPRPMIPPTIKGGLLISWCGMRGIVTLASALALPSDFPQRELLVLTAAVVTLGTLLLQGLTLPTFLRLLNFHDDDPVGREVRTARMTAYRAALTEIDGNGTKPAKVLRWELEELLRQVEGGDELAMPLDELRGQVASAARQALHAMRSDGTIGDAAFHSLEEEFDALELATHNR